MSPTQFTQSLKTPAQASNCTLKMRRDHDASLDRATARSCRLWSKEHREAIGFMVCGVLPANSGSTRGTTNLKLKPEKALSAAAHHREQLVDHRDGGGTNQHDENAWKDEYHQREN